MKSDITEYFTQLLRQSGSRDIAVAEFKRIVGEDSELKSEYAAWCEEMGYSEREGFDVFCDEYFDSQRSVWDSFNDFDE